MTWYQLYDIIQQNAQEESMPGTGREYPPIACPDCGQPLQPGNPLDPTVELFCNFDGWQAPRDWVRPESNVF